MWLDVGIDDGLRAATTELATALTDLGAPPALQVPPGNHDRTYWRAHVQDYLAWCARNSSLDDGAFGAVAAGASESPVPLRR